MFFNPSSLVRFSFSLLSCRDIVGHGKKNSCRDRGLWVATELDVHRPSRTTTRTTSAQRAWQRTRQAPRSGGSTRDSLTVLLFPALANSSQSMSRHNFPYLSQPCRDMKYYVATRGLFPLARTLLQHELSILRMRFVVLMFQE